MIIIKGTAEYFDKRKEYIKHITPAVFEGVALLWSPYGTKTPRYMSYDYCLEDFVKTVKYLEEFYYSEYKELGIQFDIERYGSEYTIYVLTPFVVVYIRTGLDLSYSFVYKKKEERFLGEIIHIVLEFVKKHVEPYIVEEDVSSLEETEEKLREIFNNSSVAKTELEEKIKYFGYKIYSFSTTDDYTYPRI